MAALNDKAAASLEEGLKKTYASKMVQFFPRGEMVIKDMDFISSEKRPGSEYVQPVALSLEHGFTYAASGAGSVTKNSTIAGEQDQASIKGHQLHGEARITYEAAAAAVKGPRAFFTATAWVMENLTKSFRYREEIRGLYGGASSIWCGVTRLGALVTDHGTGDHTYAVLDGHWSDNIMHGLKNALVNAYNDDGDDGVASTQIDTNSSAGLTVKSVDFVNKRIRLTGDDTDLTAINSAGSGVYLYFYGAFGKEPDGLVTIASNSGSLHGIDASLHPFWAGNVKDANSAALSINILEDGMLGVAAKGHAGMKFFAHTSYRGFKQLSQGIAATRQLDSSYSETKTKYGSKAYELINFYGSIEAKANGYLKEGLTLVFPEKMTKLVGAYPFQLGVPGSGNIIYDRPDNLAYGVQGYAHCAPFSEAPSSMLLVHSLGA